MELSVAEKAEVSRVEHVGHDSNTQELRDHPKVTRHYYWTQATTNIHADMELASKGTGTQ
jgi:hypothetical protein